MTTTRACSLPSALLVLAVSLGGCAASLPTVRGYHDMLRERIFRAKAHGAMECAPEDLARAQIQYRFATLELGQGDLSRATEHLQAGLLHADRALAAGESCPVEGVTAKDLMADPWSDGDGDAVADETDLCRYRIEDRDGWLDLDGCPEPDNDSDAILDRQDECPGEPEDRDAWLDQDGCPEPDNDADGIADASDACRNLVETVNGFADEDGCPDFRPEHVDVFADRIAFRRPLEFTRDGPILLGVSLPALKELARILKDNPSVHIEVLAHTHNRGDPAELLALSQGRAMSVRDALLGEGAIASQVEARGMGGEVPIATNRTAEGREANDRIEILVVAGTVETVAGTL